MILDEVGLVRRLLVAQAVAREAGALASTMLYEPSKLNIEMKGPQDFVTAADRAVEKLIGDRLAAAFPSDGFLGEEGADKASLSDGTWVVDPIDGTANFAAGRPDWCVSIGFMSQGSPEIGIIYQPAVDLLFAARRGCGATCNGKPIAVAHRPFSQSTIGLDYSPRISIGQHLAQIEAVVLAGGEYRRNGSAAVSLAQVADGRLDGFLEMYLNAWDVLAGIVIVTEAGGWCSDFLAGDGLRVGDQFAAASQASRDKLIDLLAL